MSKFSTNTNTERIRHNAYPVETTWCCQLCNWFFFLVDVIRAFLQRTSECASGDVNIIFCIQGVPSNDVPNMIYKYKL